ncbi:hypothetical protein SMD10_24335, partial [Consotaella sp. CSK11QG-6]
MHAGDVEPEKQRADAELHERTADHPDATDCTADRRDHSTAGIVLQLHIYLNDDSLPVWLVWQGVVIMSVAEWTGTLIDWRRALEEL